MANGYPQKIASVGKFHVYFNYERSELKQMFLYPNNINDFFNIVNSGQYILKNTSW